MRPGEREFQKQFYDLISVSQYWPVASWAAYQKRELESLLRHARATTPFYEGRLDPVFGSDDTFNWDRWLELPILTRPEVAAAGASLHSLAPIAAHGNLGSFSTSGSTGDPITVSLTRILQLASTVSRWRAYEWHNIDWAKSYLARQPDVSGREHGQPTGTWGPPWDERSKEGVLYYLGKSLDMEGIVDLLDRLRPAYFSNGPRMTVPLAEIALRRGLRIEMEAIFPYGEAVTEVEREAAREAFGGCRIIDHYSSNECGAIAHECPSGNGLHVHAESILVEIVDDSGVPCQPGGEGRVVVTPFSSTRMPLIRYDLGDRAIVGSACSCGRTLPLMKAITGRTTALFRHPDGRMANNMLSSDLRKLIGAAQWQVAQTGPTAFEVRYTARDWGVPRDEAAFEAEFRKLFFEDSQLRFVEVRELPKTKAGKFIEYTNEWRP